ncbi:MAG: 2-C-methyl-D-erythritol 4-phosphate cytidylyltransferase [Vulcanimicrobiaceae bacterium]
MSWAAVVVAAGRGTRFGRPKQLVEIAGRPMLAWSIETLARISEIGTLVVTTEPENISDFEAVVAAHAGPLRTRVVRGGEERQDSVRTALESLSALDDVPKFVLVHDGARPMVEAGDVRRGMDVTAPGTGALLAIPVVDTIKRVDDAGRVIRTYDRAQLWAAQTPQFASFDDLLRAHRHAQRAGLRVTDDAALLENIGLTVRIVEGRADNFKVTVPADLERAELILRGRAAARSL